MNSRNLNKWLTLGANFGVLIGLVVVVIELQQTQIMMSAESSIQRAQMSRENASMAAQYSIGEIETKLATGQEITLEERRNAREFYDRLLRHYEVMHYQYQLGILDEEIWENNAIGIRDFMNGPFLTYLYSDWPNGGIALRLRRSFVDFTLDVMQ